MVKEIIEDLKSVSGSAVGEPASNSMIAECLSAMDKVIGKNLPKEYVEFLKQANGIMWNGIEFFCSTEGALKKYGQSLTDVVAANELYKDIKQIVLLGTTDEDVLVYNNEKNSYDVLDRVDFEEMDDYESFEELFECIIKERM